jgi:hypothetical protein
MKVAIQAGFRVVALDPDGNAPLFGLTKGKRRCMARLDDQVPGNNLFQTLTLQCVLTAREPLTPLALNRLNAQLFGVKAVRHQTQQVFIERGLRFDGGITVPWLVSSLQNWDQTHRSAVRLVASGLVPQKARSRVH